MIGTRTIRAGALLALFALLLMACAPSAPPAATQAPASTQAPAATMAPSKPEGAATTAPASAGTAAAAKPAATSGAALPADFQPITLRAAEQLPPTGLASEEIQWFAQELERRTDGKVKIQFFWSQSLAKATDMIPALNSGIADIASIPSTYDPARTANWTVVDMPDNSTDYWCGINAAWELYKMDPGLQAEFQKNGFRPIVSYSSGNFHVMTKDPVRNLNDLQGKNIRVYGGAQLNWMQQFGVNAIFMNYNDIYEAVQRGTVDGALATLYLTETWKHYEVAKHMTLMQHGFVVGAPQMSISLRVWNSFPDSLKQIFDEISVEHNQRFARDLMALETDLQKRFEGLGMQFYEFSAEDNAALSEAAQRANADWIQQMSARGAQAQQTWDNLQRLNSECMADVEANGYPWE